MRRTRKTHKQRLNRLRQSIRDGIPSFSNGQLNQLISFCRRRGFSFDVDEQASEGFHVHRDQFFASLREWLEVNLPSEVHTRVLELCRKHLNADCRSENEIRPARFENRGRAKCHWEHCRRNVPRSGNDIKGRLRQSWYLWLQPVWKELQAPDVFQKSLEHWITELEGLSAALRSGKAPKPIRTRIYRVFENFLKRVGEVAPEYYEEFSERWKEFYRRNTMDILTGQKGGRVRFCREHSEEFVKFTLQSRAIPIREDLNEQDIISRKQQILFRRLWRYIDGRILPLAEGRIDNLVVERVAFDVLEGPIKKRQKLTDAKAYELYWQGPAAGFKSRQEMFDAEFGGRCVYCGEIFPSLEVEHIFHQSKFPFDSYLNLVPACRQCNAQKGGRTMGEANLTISDSAYEHFSQYLRKRGAVHPYHNIKKGLMNLLRRPITVSKGEKMLGMIAENLVTVASSQRGPRPLARYLASRIQEKTGSVGKTYSTVSLHTDAK